MSKPPLRVRGACPVCGHVVETDAPAGRVTWRGPCPARGCKGRVYASRIKAGDRPPRPATAGSADDGADGSAGDVAGDDSKASAPAGRPRRKVGPPRGYKPKPTSTEREHVRRPDPDDAGRPAGDRGTPDDGPDRPAPAGDADEHDYRDAGDGPAGARPDGGRPVPRADRPEHGNEGAPRRRRLWPRRPERTEHPRRTVTPYEHLY